MGRAINFRNLARVFTVLAATILLAACSSSEDRAVSYYNSGVALAEQGELVKASLEFRNALKLKPEYPEALFAFAEIEEQQAHYDGAARLYLAVTEQDQTHVEARVRLSYLFLAAGQAEAAKTYADQAFEIDPENTTAVIALAAVQLRLGATEEAVRLANLALDKDPKLDNALMVLASERLVASDPQGALDYLSRAGEDSERNIGLQALRLAALDAIGDQPGVENLFNRLIELFPENPAFRQNLVNWYLSKNRADDAERVVLAMAEQSPENDQIQLYLVGFLNAQKGVAAASDALKDIVAKRKADGKDAFDLELTLANMLYAQGEQEVALEQMRAIVDAASEDALRNRAQIELARMEVNSNNTDTALGLLDSVLAGDEKNAGALGLRASIRLVEGKIDTAVEDLRVAINEAPDDAVLHALLAEAYQKQGDALLAEEQYSKAFSLGQNSSQFGLPMAQFLLSYGKQDQAERVLDAVRQREPGNRQALTLLAQLRLARQDWVGAQQVADALRALDDDSKVTGDRISAAALGGMSRFTESISLLEAAAADSNASEAIIADLVRAYVRAGRHEAAVQYLTGLLQDRPDNAQFWVLLGSVHSSVQKFDAALEAFEKAASIPGSPLGDISLAEFLISSDKLDDARSAAEAALSEHGDNEALRLLLASIYERLQDFDSAIDQYRQLYERTPDSTVVANGLASLLSERGDGGEDLDLAFDIAQRFRGTQIPHYQDTLGWIYFLKGEYTFALPPLRTAAERLPDHALVQLHYGLVLQQLRQNERAIETIERALTLEPALFDTDKVRAEAALEALRSGATPEVVTQ